MSVSSGQPPAQASATVRCSKYEEDLPAITSPITFAGEFAAKVRANVSQKAWREWLDMQIKVINEFRLHMGEPAHRKLLEDHAARFFRFDGGDGSLGVGPEGGLS